MGAPDRRICYQELSSWQEWRLVRSGGFFAFGRPPDFRIPWEIPLEQCGTLEDVIEHLERRLYRTVDTEMEQKFLQVLQSLRKEKEEKQYAQ